MTIHMKVLPGKAAYGNTVRISYTGNAETVPALTDIVDQNGNNPAAIVINKIEKVMNFSGATVAGTIGGYDFGTGTWDLDESGGLVIDTPLTAGQALPGADNCLITVRGYVQWTDPDHAKFI